MRHPPHRSTTPAVKSSIHPLSEPASVSRPIFKTIMPAAASLASSSAYCACSFQAARPNTRARRQHRLAVTSQATHEVARNRALVAGLALVASVPLVFSGTANAFVGNTAKDFSEKVEEVTPDVPLPGLKQKGKEAEAIGKLKGPQSGPGAADQLPFPEAVPSKASVAQAKDAITDGGGVGGDHLILHFFRVQVKGAVGDVADKASDVSKGALGDTPKPKGGLFGRINEEALTKNSPSKQIGK
ncbi:TPA: hypothetical protein ACH3X3_002536 [Trebouxia sp. C0006]